MSRVVPDDDFDRKILRLGLSDGFDDRLWRIGRGAAFGDLLPSLGLFLPGLRGLGSPFGSCISPPGPKILILGFIKEMSFFLLRKGVYHKRKNNNMKMEIEHKRWSTNENEELKKIYTSMRVCIADIRTSMQE